VSGKSLADRFESCPVIADEMGQRINTQLENPFALSK